MKQSTFDYIPVQVLLARLLSKWYWFAISLVLFIGLAKVYLMTKDDIYEVKATLLLDEKKGLEELNGSDNFMKELGLFEQRSELQDEIGILTSYSLVEQAVRPLNQGISYFKQGKVKSRQVFNNLPFLVLVDSSHYQLINLTINVKPVSKDFFMLEAEGEDVWVYLPTENKVVLELPEISFKQKIRLNESFQSQYLKFELVSNPARKDPSAPIKSEYSFSINSFDQLTEYYREKLVVKPYDEETKKGKLVELSSQGPSIELETRFLNELIDAYISYETEKSRKDGVKIVKFLDNQMAKVADSLARVEYSLSYFRESRNIADLATASKKLTEELLELERDRAALTVKSQQVEYIYENLQNARGDGDGDFSPATVDIEDASLQNLLIELNKLKAEKAEMTLSAKGDNPRLGQINSKIENIEARVLEITRNMVNTQRIALDVYNNRISEVRGRMSSLPSDERELTRLQREFKAKSDLFKYLQEKKAEASVAVANSSSNNLIVDKARQAGDTPVSPNRMLFYLLALVLGGGLPGAVILGADLLNDKVSSLRALESSTDIKVLGLIINNDTKANVLTAQNSDSVLAECFRAVRVRMQDMGGTVPIKVIGVTSTWAGEGKTFCANNLSSILAQSGKRTVLVDVDLRKPRMMEYHEVDNICGLSTYLRGQHNLDQIIQSSKIENLDLISSGPAQLNALDLIDTERFFRLIQELKAEYDYVILDTPPIGQTTDYVILKSYTDFTLYIVRHNKTKLQTLNMINEMYEDGNVGNIGILVNDIKLNQAFGYGGEKIYGYGKKLTY
ncbi:MAG: polysaccharide biosynthesis tyrosine autokinase [Bacteroidota bacterium]